MTAYHVAFVVAVVSLAGAGYAFHRGRVLTRGMVAFLCLCVCVLAAIYG